MRWLSFSGLRVKLIFLVLIAVIPALGLTFYSGIEQRRHARLNALGDALDLAKKVSDDQERLIERTHQLLVDLAKMDQVLQCQSSGDSPFLASLLKESPFYTNFGTTGPDGQVICSALPMKQPVNFADREWFPRILHTRKFTVSEYLIGRITGKPSIVLSYPILAGKDLLKGVIFAGLDLDWLNQIGAKAKLPSGSVLTVIDRKGTILAHYPDPEKWVGQSMSNSPIVKTIMTRQGEGTVEMVGIDSVLRLYAFTPLSDRAEVGAYVAVGIPSTVAFAEANRTLIRNLTWLGIMAALAFVAAWFIGGFLIVHPVNRLLNVTNRLTDGDLAARLGPSYIRGEIDQLARSFDEMADSLECRDAERKRAEETLRESEEKARQLAQENAVMAETGRIISSTLDIEEVYKRFAKEVAKLIPFDRIMINMINPEKNTTSFAYIAGIDVPDRRVGDITPLRGTATFECMRTRSSMLIQPDDIEECLARFPALLPSFQAGLRSIMFIPLISKDQFIGTLSLRSLKPKAYTDQDVRVAEGIANQVAGAIANAQLYTERIQAEKERAAIQDQFRQSQKMEAIGSLAGGVAHDFNNLLTIIKGYGQLSLMELKEGDPLKANIEEVLKAAERAAGLTRQLLAFSRRQSLEMRVLDLNTTLRDLDKMLRRIIGEDIELVTLLADDLGTVKADPGQIEQVAMNLAVNARDAMQKGGKLTIETANVELDENYGRNHVAVKPGPYVMLSVSDTGVGMTPEVRDRVFEPFFTTKEKGKGTGLGLSTVYGIVKQSGGNIWVYSEPGKGTAFKIYLPRVDEPLEEAGEVVVQKELPAGGETILVVEDEEKVRQLTVRILTKNGYTVLEASHGGEASHICEQHKGPIHLMVMDVVMPGINGRELAKSLEPHHPEMKVLYMSGYTDNAIVHHGILEKGLNFIQKPFTMDGLIRKVREVLDK